MKRRMIAIALAMCICGSAPAYAKGFLSSISESENSDSPLESESETFTPITSGELYEKVKVIDQGFEISQSSSGSLAFDLTADNIDRQRVINYYWKIVQIMDLKANENQDSMSFLLLGKKNGKSYMSSVSISDFKGIVSDFTSYQFVYSEEDEVKGLLKDFYNTFFGAHTTENGFEKIKHDYDPVNNPLPSNYRNAFLWILSNFKVGSGYDVNDAKIEVTETVPNTKEGGIATYVANTSAFYEYQNWLDAFPETMPYNTIEIRYVDETNTAYLIWDFYLSNLSGGWEGSSSQAPSEFQSGLSAGKIVWDSGQVVKN